MFLAIINDTYSEVKEELSKDQDGFQFTDIIKQVAELPYSAAVRNTSNDEGV